MYKTVSGNAGVFINRPLDTDEIIYKRAWEAGPAFLWDRAMSFAEYDEFDREGLIVRVDDAHFYASQGRDRQGVTISPVKSIVNASVTLHRRYCYPVLHNHDYVELIYVAAGSCRHYTEDGFFDLNEGDICILAPEVLHALACTQDESCILYMMMNRDFLNRSFLDVLKGGKPQSSFFEEILYARKFSPYILFPTGSDPWLHVLAERMIREEPGHSHAYEYSIGLLVQAFLLHVIREYEEKAMVPGMKHASRNALVLAVTEYLNVNYASATLASTAAFFGYTPSYLSRYIHQQTGRAFSGMLDERKMQAAGTLLKDTTQSFTEIAQAVGCFDGSHFSKKFKAFYGVSPSRFRKDNAAKQA